MPVVSSTTQAVATTQANQWEIKSWYLDVPATGDVLTVVFAAQLVTNGVVVSETLLAPVVYTGTTLAAVMTDVGNRYSSNVGAGQAQALALRNAIKDALYAQLQADGYVPSTNVTVE